METLKCIHNALTATIFLIFVLICVLVNKCCLIYSGGDSRKECTCEEIEITGEITPSNNIIVKKPGQSTIKLPLYYYLQNQAGEPSPSCERCCAKQQLEVIHPPQSSSESEESNLTNESDDYIKHTVQVKVRLSDSESEEQIPEEDIRPSTASPRRRQGDGEDFRRAHTPDGGDIHHTIKVIQEDSQSRDGSQSTKIFTNINIPLDDMHIHPITPSTRSSIKTQDSRSNNDYFSRHSISSIESRSATRFFDSGKSRLEPRVDRKRSRLGKASNDSSRVSENDHVRPTTAPSKLYSYPDTERGNLVSDRGTSSRRYGNDTEVARSTSIEDERRVSLGGSITGRIRRSYDNTNQSGASHTDDRKINPSESFSDDSDIKPSPPRDEVIYSKILITDRPRSSPFNPRSTGATSRRGVKKKTPTTAKDRSSRSQEVDKNLIEDKVNSKWQEKLAEPTYDDKRPSVEDETKEKLQPRDRARKRSYDNTDQSGESHRDDTKFSLQLNDNSEAKPPISSTDKKSALEPSKYQRKTSRDEDNTPKITTRIDDSKFLTKDRRSSPSSPRTAGNTLASEEKQPTSIDAENVDSKPQELPENELKVKAVSKWRENRTENTSDDQTPSSSKTNKDILSRMSDKQSDETDKLLHNKFKGRGRRSFEEDRITTDLFDGKCDVRCTGGMKQRSSFDRKKYADRPYERKSSIGHSYNSEFISALKDLESKCRESNDQVSSSQLRYKQLPDCCTTQPEKLEYKNQLSKDATIQEKKLKADDQYLQELRSYLRANNKIPECCVYHPKEISKPVESSSNISDPTIIDRSSVFNVPPKSEATFFEKDETRKLYDKIRAEVSKESALLSEEELTSDHPPTRQLFKQDYNKFESKPEESYRRKSEEPILIYNKDTGKYEVTSKYKIPSSSDEESCKKYCDRMRIPPCPVDQRYRYVQEDIGRFISDDDVVTPNHSSVVSRKRARRPISDDSNDKDLKAHFKHSKKVKHDANNQTNYDDDIETLYEQKSRNKCKPVLIPCCCSLRTQDRDIILGDEETEPIHRHRSMPAKKYGSTEEGKTLDDEDISDPRKIRSHSYKNKTVRDSQNLVGNKDSQSPHVTDHSSKRIKNGSSAGSYGSGYATSNSSDGTWRPGGQRDSDDDFSSPQVKLMTARSKKTKPDVDYDADIGLHKIRTASASISSQTISAEPHTATVSSGATFSSEETFETPEKRDEEITRLYKKYGSPTDIARLEKLNKKTDNTNKEIIDEEESDPSVKVPEKSKFVESIITDDSCQDKKGKSKESIVKFTDIASLKKLNKKTDNTKKEIIDEKESTPSVKVPFKSKSVESIIIDDSGQDKKGKSKESIDKSARRSLSVKSIFSQYSDKSKGKGSTQSVISVDIHYSKDKVKPKNLLDEDKLKQSKKSKLPVPIKEKKKTHPINSKEGTSHQKENASDMLQDYDSQNHLNPNRSTNNSKDFHDSGPSSKKWVNSGLPLIKTSKTKISTVQSQENSVSLPNIDDEETSQKSVEPKAQVDLYPKGKETEPSQEPRDNCTTRPYYTPVGPILREIMKSVENFEDLFKTEKPSDKEKIKEISKTISLDKLSLSFKKELDKLESQQSTGAKLNDSLKSVSSESNQKGMSDKKQHDLNFTDEICNGDDVNFVKRRHRGYDDEDMSPKKRKVDISGKKGAVESSDISNIANDEDEDSNLLVGTTLTMPHSSRGKSDRIKQKNDNEYSDKNNISPAIKADTNLQEILSNGSNKEISVSSSVIRDNLGYPNLSGMFQGNSSKRFVSEETIPSEEMYKRDEYYKQSPEEGSERRRKQKHSEKPSEKRESRKWNSLLGEIILPTEFIVPNIKDSIQKKTENPGISKNNIREQISPEKLKIEKNSLVDQIILPEEFFAPDIKDYKKKTKIPDTSKNKKSNVISPSTVKLKENASISKNVISKESIPLDKKEVDVKVGKSSIVNNKINTTIEDNIFSDINKEEKERGEKPSKKDFKKELSRKWSSLPLEFNIPYVKDYIQNKTENPVTSKDKINEEIEENFRKSENTIPKESISSNKKEFDAKPGESGNFNENKKEVKEAKKHSDVKSKLPTPSSKKDAYTEKSSIVNKLTANEILSQRKKKQTYPKKPKDIKSNDSIPSDKNDRPKDHSTGSNKDSSPNTSIKMGHIYPYLSGMVQASDSRRFLSEEAIPSIETVTRDESYNLPPDIHSILSNEEGSRRRRKGKRSEKPSEKRESRKLSSLLGEIILPTEFIVPNIKDSIQKETENPGISKDKIRDQISPDKLKIEKNSLVEQIILPEEFLAPNIKDYRQKKTKIPDTSKNRTSDEISPSKVKLEKNANISKNVISKESIPLDKKEVDPKAAKSGRESIPVNNKCSCLKPGTVLPKGTILVHQESVKDGIEDHEFDKPEKKVHLYPQGIEKFPSHELRQDMKSRPYYTLIAPYILTPTDSEEDANILFYLNENPVDRRKFETDNSLSDSDEESLTFLDDCCPKEYCKKGKESLLVGSDGSLIKCRCKMKGEKKGPCICPKQKDSEQFRKKKGSLVIKKESRIEKPGISSLKSVVSSNKNSDKKQNKKYSNERPKKHQESSYKEYNFDEESVTFSEGIISLDEDQKVIMKTVLEKRLETDTKPIHKKDICDEKSIILSEKEGILGKPLKKNDNFIDKNLDKNQDKIIPKIFRTQKDINGEKPSTSLQDVIVPLDELEKEQKIKVPESVTVPKDLQFIKQIEKYSEDRELFEESRKIKRKMVKQNSIITPEAITTDSGTDTEIDDIIQQYITEKCGMKEDIKGKNSAIIVPKHDTVENSTDTEIDEVIEKYIIDKYRIKKGTKEEQPTRIVPKIITVDNATSSEFNKESNVAVPEKPRMQEKAKNDNLTGPNSVSIISDSNSLSGCIETIFKGTLNNENDIPPENVSCYTFTDNIPSSIICFDNIRRPVYKSEEDEENISPKLYISTDETESRKPGIISDKKASFYPQGDEFEQSTSRSREYCEPYCAPYISAEKGRKITVDPYDNKTIIYTDDDVSDPYSKGMRPYYTPYIPAHENLDAESRKAQAPCDKNRKVYQQMDDSEQSTSRLREQYYMPADKVLNNIKRRNEVHNDTFAKLYSEGNESETSIYSVESIKPYYEPYIPGDENLDQERKEARVLYDENDIFYQQEVYFEPSISHSRDSYYNTADENLDEEKRKAKDPREKVTKSDSQSDVSEPSSSYHKENIQPYYTPHVATGKNSDEEREKATDSRDEIEKFYPETDKTETSAPYYGEIIQPYYTPYIPAAENLDEEKRKDKVTRDKIDKFDPESDESVPSLSYSEESIQSHYTPYNLAADNFDEEKRKTKVPRDAIEKFEPDSDKTETCAPYYGESIQPHYTSYRPADENLDEEKRGTKVSLEKVTKSDSQGDVSEPSASYHEECVRPYYTPYITAAENLDEEKRRAKVSLEKVTKSDSQGDVSEPSASYHEENIQPYYTPYITADKNHDEERRKDQVLRDKIDKFDLESDESVSSLSYSEESIQSHYTPYNNLAGENFDEEKSKTKVIREEIEKFDPDSDKTETCAPYYGESIQPHYTSDKPADENLDEEKWGTKVSREKVTKSDSQGDISEPSVSCHEECVRPYYTPYNLAAENFDEEKRQNKVSREKITKSDYQGNISEPSASYSEENIHPHYKLYNLADENLNEERSKVKIPRDKIKKFDPESDESEPSVSYYEERIQSHYTSYNPADENFNEESRKVKIIDDKITKFDADSDESELSVSYYAESIQVHYTRYNPADENINEERRKAKFSRNKIMKFDPESDEYEPSVSYYRESIQPHYTPYIPPDENLDEERRNAKIPCHKIGKFDPQGDESELSVSYYGESIQPHYTPFTPAVENLDEKKKRAKVPREKIAKCDPQEKESESSVFYHGESIQSHFTPYSPADKNLDKEKGRAKVSRQKITNCDSQDNVSEHSASYHEKTIQSYYTPYIPSEENLDEARKKSKVPRDRIGKFDPQVKYEPSASYYEESIQPYYTPFILSDENLDEARRKVNAPRGEESEPSTHYTGERILPYYTPYIPTDGKSNAEELCAKNYKYYPQEVDTEPSVSCSKESDYIPAHEDLNKAKRKDLIEERRKAEVPCDKNEHFYFQKDDSESSFSRFRKWNTIADKYIDEENIKSEDPCQKYEFEPSAPRSEKSMKPYYTPYIRIRTDADFDSERRIYEVPCDKNAKFYSEGDEFESSGVGRSPYYTPYILTDKDLAEEYITDKSKLYLQDEESELLTPWSIESFEPLYISYSPVDLSKSIKTSCDKIETIYIQDDVSHPSTSSPKRIQPYYTPYIPVDEYRRNADVCRRKNLNFYLQEKDLFCFRENIQSFCSLYTHVFTDTDFVEERRIAQCNKIAKFYAHDYDLEPPLSRPRSIQSCYSTYIPTIEERRIAEVPCVEKNKFYLQDNEFEPSAFRSKERFQQYDTSYTRIFTDEDFSEERKISSVLRGKIVNYHPLNSEPFTSCSEIFQPYSIYYISAKEIIEDVIAKAEIICNQIVKFYPEDNKTESSKNRPYVIQFIPVDEEIKDSSTNETTKILPEGNEFEENVIYFPEGYKSENYSSRSRENIQPHYTSHIIGDEDQGFVIKQDKEITKCSCKKKGENKRPYICKKNQHLLSDSKTHEDANEELNKKTRKAEISLEENVIHYSENDKTEQSTTGPREIIQPYYTSPIIGDEDQGFVTEKDKEITKCHCRKKGEDKRPCICKRKQHLLSNSKTHEDANEELNKEIRKAEISLEENVIHYSENDKIEQSTTGSREIIQPYYTSPIIGDEEQGFVIEKAKEITKCYCKKKGEDKRPCICKKMIYPSSVDAVENISNKIKKAEISLEENVIHYRENDKTEQPTSGSREIIQLYCTSHFLSDEDQSFVIEKNEHQPSSDSRTYEGANEDLNKKTKSDITYNENVMCNIEYDKFELSTSRSREIFQPYYASYIPTDEDLVKERKEAEILRQEQSQFDSQWDKTEPSTSLQKNLPSYYPTYCPIEEDHNVRRTAEDTRDKKEHFSPEVNVVTSSYEDIVKLLYGQNIQEESVSSITGQMVEKSQQGFIIGRNGELIKCTCTSKGPQNDPCICWKKYQSISDDTTRQNEMYYTENVTNKMEMHLFSNTNLTDYEKLKNYQEGRYAEPDSNSLPPDRSFTGSRNYNTKNSTQDEPSNASTKLTEESSIEDNTDRVQRRLIRIRPNGCDSKVETYKVSSKINISSRGEANIVELTDSIPNNPLLRIRISKTQQPVKNDLVYSTSRPTASERSTDASKMPNESTRDYLVRLRKNNIIPSTINETSPESHRTESLNDRKFISSYISDIVSKYHKALEANTEELYLTECLETMQQRKAMKYVSDEPSTSGRLDYVNFYPCRNHQSNKKEVSQTCSKPTYHSVNSPPNRPYNTVCPPKKHYCVPLPPNYNHVMRVYSPLDVPNCNSSAKNIYVRDKTKNKQCCQLHVCRRLHPQACYDPNDLPSTSRAPDSQNYCCCKECRGQNCCVQNQFK